MQTFAALVEKFSDYGVRLGRLQQLDPRLAHRQHRDVYFLLCDRLPHRDVQAKLVAIEPQRLVERPDGDSQMIDFTAVQASHSVPNKDRDAFPPRRVPPLEI